MQISWTAPKRAATKLQLDPMAPLDQLNLFALEPAALGKPLAVPIGLLDADPSNPRTEFPQDHLDELAQDIALRGILQPIVVDAAGLPGRYRIRFGSKRWRAAKQAGLAEVPVIIMDQPSDAYDQVAENTRRHGLSALELATFMHSRIDAGESNAAVERIIASCDQSSPAGMRDRAILLLLARLGLRAGDIVQLRLQDIDWKEATIQVCGKSRRQTQLPLSQEVGQAIVDYLQRGRPATCHDQLFLRSRAPFRGLRSHCAVSVLVDRAIGRAGVAKPARGAAHLLRHSVASSMLRQGASLQEIADLLRHRSVETTQIYAKVDVTSLQEIAQPWPEVAPC